MADVKKMATRDGYGKGLVALGAEHPDVVVLDADLAGSTKTGMFAKAYPDRHFNCGIAEGNMMAVAAGLAAAGKVPFASSFAMFAAGRAFEQVRNSIGYPKLNVKIGATHGGMSVGEDGAMREAIASGATATVGAVCKDLLGSIGGVIALIGIIVLPITSGDTALRGLRLTIAETFGIKQDTNSKRLTLSAIIFAVVAAILVFAKMNANGFNILWRYFAWSNQTLSLFAFAAIAVWMFVNGKKKYVWIPMIPAVFYAFVTVTYIMNAKIGFNLPWGAAYAVGAVAAVIYLIAVIVYGKKRNAAK